MKDEIKEILDRLKYIVFNEIIDYGEELSLNECKLLLNYITNLQQENELRQQDINNLTYQLGKEKEIKRKAIEYINKNKHLSMFADCREPEEDWNYDLEINPRDLLNILQGSEDKC